MGKSEPNQSKTTKSKSNPKSKKKKKDSEKIESKKKPSQSSKESVEPSKKSKPESTSNDTEDNKKNTKDLTVETEEELKDVLPSLPSLDENLQKLITPEERAQMEENLDLVVCYLEDIGIVDLNIDREKLIVTVPFDYEDFTFLSHIVLSPEWILIKTSIFEIESLTDVAIFELFAEILKGNFILNSVVYALDPENKSIWAQADVPISTDFETFKLSYFSIVFAIDYFMKNISPKIDLQLKSTLDKENFESSPSNLYI